MRERKWIICLGICVSWVCVVCGASADPASDSLVLKSTAIDEGKPIPKAHTCDGKDVSPPLSWAAVPAGTRSIALICDDPDAPMGTWVHWVLYDLPPDVKNLAGDLPREDRLASGARQGRNDFGKIGYNGPCPPGGTHRYFFRVYALDAAGLPAGLTKAGLLEAMEGHVLAEGSLMGTYSRKQGETR